MTEPEYDPETCITAGELRASGVNVPANIPDCGWVHRHMIRLTVDRAQPRLEELPLMLTIRCTLVALEPFRWVECSVRFDPAS